MWAAFTLWRQRRRLKRRAAWCRVIDHDPHWWGADGRQLEYPYCRRCLEPLGLQLSTGSFQRMDGAVECTICGGEARKHPFDYNLRGFDGQPYLYLLCDGTLAKL